MAGLHERALHDRGVYRQQGRLRRLVRASLYGRGRERIERERKKTEPAPIHGILLSFHRTDAKIRRTDRQAAG